MDLGKKIKLYREKNNLTQKDLANNAGISLRALSNYETGKRKPPLEILIKLSDALKVPIDLLSDPEDKKLPSMQIVDKYRNDSFNAIDILISYLKNNAVQEDINYKYETNEFYPLFSIDDIYIFVNEMLEMKFAKMTKVDIAIELLLRNYGSSKDKFTDRENEIIKDTICQYVNSMIDFKREQKGRKL